MYASRVLAKSLRASVRIGPVRMRPTKDIMTVTKRAEEQILRLAEQETTNKLLRIGLKTKGCNGQAYHIDFVSPDELEKLDEEIELQSGLKLFIHRRAQISIIGTEMDYEENRLYEGFVFTNPNAKGTCGCGESFNI